PVGSFEAEGLRLPVAQDAGRREAAGEGTEVEDFDPHRRRPEVTVVASPEAAVDAARLELRPDDDRALRNALLLLGRRRSRGEEDDDGGAGEPGTDASTSRKGSHRRRGRPPTQAASPSSSSFDRSFFFVSPSASRSARATSSSLRWVSSTFGYCRFISS